MKRTSAEIIKNIKQLIESALFEEPDPTMLGLDKIKKYFQSKNYYIFNETNEALFGIASISASENEDNAQYYVVTETTIRNGISKDQQYTVIHHGLGGRMKMLSGHILNSSEEVIELLNSLPLPAGRNLK